MSTGLQGSVRLRPKVKRRPSAVIRSNPQLQGDVVRPRICTPRKPNSARRPVVKAKLTNILFVVAHIPGSGHNLRRHSDTLIRGGGARDLPGVYHTCIRGTYDFAGLHQKTRRRSIYGASRPIIGMPRLRRKYRQAL